MLSSPKPDSGRPPAARLLLDWYDRHRRELPWRAGPGQPADPYKVWLSEIMLQQTTVATVGPYFGTFLARWPTVCDLAAADLDAVLHAWQGLGYYARARNLHRCAQAVARDHGGVFPDTEAALLELPGIGPYTAAAVAAIAFDRKAAAVDGNVERVMSRLHALAPPLPAARPALRRLALGMTPERRSGDYAQALMDLGATVCTPRKPRCLLCPWAADCRAHALGEEERFPVKPGRKVRPTRYGLAFWIERPDGKVLIRRRAEKGLLGGLMELPGSDWRAEPWQEAEIAGAIAAAAGACSTSCRIAGDVGHTFTHFHLELTVIVLKAGGSEAEGIWVAPESLGDYALPVLMKKAVARARG